MYLTKCVLLIIKKLEKEQLLQKLSLISRININDSEKEAYIDKLSKFIEWSHKIDEIDTSNINPMFNVLEWLGYYNENFRTDEVSVSDNSEDLIKNSPDKEDVFIAVPKIIE